MANKKNYGHLNEEVIIEELLRNQLPSWRIAQLAGSKAKGKHSLTQALYQKVKNSYKIQHAIRNYDIERLEALTKLQDALIKSVNEKDLISKLTPKQCLDNLLKLNKSIFEMCDSFEKQIKN